MVNKYYQKHKERLQKKKKREDIKIFLKKNKIIGEKKSEIDIKILQKKKTKTTCENGKVLFNT